MPTRRWAIRSAGFLSSVPSQADVDDAFVGYIQPGLLLGVFAMKELGLTGLTTWFGAPQRGWRARGGPTFWARESPRRGPGGIVGA